MLKTLLKSGIWFGGGGAAEIKIPTFLFLLEPVLSSFLHTQLYLRLYNLYPEDGVRNASEILVAT
jgi:hypothetical protein